ncbi:MAG: hypothetical protein M1820_009455 [Bogoriella megaspora]|nr:MAG: hypothetical protein M1820_009455 [Bogoriella megaspora]
MKTNNIFLLSVMVAVAAGAAESSVTAIVTTELTYQAPGESISPATTEAARLLERGDTGDELHNLQPRNGQSQGISRITEDVYGIVASNSRAAASRASASWAARTRAAAAQAVASRVRASKSSVSKASVSKASVSRASASRVSAAKSSASKASSISRDLASFFSAHPAPRTTSTPPPPPPSPQPPPPSTPAPPPPASSPNGNGQWCMDLQHNTRYPGPCTS